MSTATSASAGAASGPSLRTRIAAIAVVAALGLLAYYAVFSGPTTVPVPGPTITSPAPATQAPPPGEGGEGQGERGD